MGRGGGSKHDLSVVAKSEWQRAFDDILSRNDLSVSTRMIGLYVLKYRNWKRGVAWPSIGRLAHEAGMSRSTVHRALAELELAGVLRRKSVNGHNEYEFCVCPATFAGSGGEWSLDLETLTRCGAPESKRG